MSEKTAVLDPELTPPQRFDGYLAASGEVMPFGTEFFAPTPPAPGIERAASHVLTFPGTPLEDTKQFD